MFQHTRAKQYRQQHESKPFALVSVLIFRIDAPFSPINSATSCHVSIEGKRETERERQRDRETERQRDRETEREE